MNSLVDRVRSYFTDLGFYPDRIDLGGLPQKRLAWSVTAYLLLFTGILSQQLIDLSKKPLSISLNNLSAPILGASALVALALFPTFTHWFNAKRKKPSWEHVLWAFSFGFFMNLSSNLIWKKWF